MDSALDPVSAGDGPVPAARSGVIRTKAVETRTTLLLLRLRYHVLTTTGDETVPLLAEDTRIVAFQSAPDSAQWLSADEAQALLLAEPDANVTDDVARNFIEKVTSQFHHLREHLNEVAKERGQELLEAHKRVRTASRRTGIKHEVEPQLPPDVLGLYVYLPAL